MSFWQALGETLFGDDKPAHPARKISRGEYMLLVAATAQALAGQGRVPNAAQISFAEKMVKQNLTTKNVTVMGGTEILDATFRQVKRKLSSSMGSWSAGSFWDKVKSFASSAASTARRVAPYALPLLAPAIAAPFVIKAVQGLQSSSSEAAAPPPPPPAESTDESGFDFKSITSAFTKAKTAALDTHAPSSEETEAAGEAGPAEASALARLRQESGVSDGLAAIKDAVAQALMKDKLAKAAEKNKRVAELETEISMYEARHRGGSDPDADADDDSMGATRPPFYFPSFATIGGLSHNSYRAAVMRAAQKLAGNGEPGTKHFYLAKRAIDAKLKQGGVDVKIPGASAARVTR